MFRLFIFILFLGCGSVLAADADIDGIVNELRVEQMAGKSAMDEIMMKGFSDESREDWR